jgi:adenylate cyclase
MAEDRVQRRLAAILAADVVGYSRLMEADEAATLAVLKARRKEVLGPLVAKHQGRVFKVAGDGVLVEFASAVNAVQCAVELQQSMVAANIGQPEERHIVLRIGINLGDVMVEGSDLYGDGVNIAARLEGIAEPGSVIVSGTAFDHIKSKVKVGFEDLGPQILKNITEAVRAYRVTGSPPAAAWQSKAVANRPSIAVLAFDNMSGDPEQEYFSDGIAEDIITDLSKISTLAVTARNTSFAFKGKAIDIGQVARQLNVTHVLEGSVRKAGNRIRITAQLIDGKLGHHLWAERYDRNLDDIFVLQDEISRAIVVALKIKLAPTEHTSIGQRTTENVDAYQLYLMGRHYYLRRNRQSVRTSIDLFRRATETDPNYARAWAALALAHSRTKRTSRWAISLEEIEELVDRAMHLDSELAEAHVARGRCLHHRLRTDEAEAACRRAIELDSDLPEAHAALGDILRRSTRWLDAAQQYEVAVAIDANDYISPCLAQGCYEELSMSADAKRMAVEAKRRLETAVRSDPEDSNAYSLGCFILEYLGDRQQAIDYANRAVEADPQDTQAQYNAACFFSRIGEIERTFDLLDRCIRSMGQWQLDWMKRDPDFDKIREHPRYRSLVAREEARLATESATPRTEQASSTH